MENVVNKADIEWSDIEALGITNQRETTVVWDRQTSEPVYNAIVCRIAARPTTATRCANAV